MKIITINDRYAIVEKRRDIDRKNNLMHVEFSLEMKYGVAPTGDDDHIQVIHAFQISDKSENGKYKSLWDRVKNSDRDDLIQMVFTDLKKLLRQVKRKEAGKIESEDYRRSVRESELMGGMYFLVAHINSTIKDPDLKLEVV